MKFPGMMIITPTHQPPLIPLFILFVFLHLREKYNYLSLFNVFTSSLFCHRSSIQMKGKFILVWLFFQNGRKTVPWITLLSFTVSFLSKKMVAVIFYYFMVSVLFSSRKKRQVKKENVGFSIKLFTRLMFLIINGKIYYRFKENISFPGGKSFY